MPFRKFILSLSLVLLTLCSCGPGEKPHRKALEDTAQAMDAFNTVLAKITDEPSAKEHHDDLMAEMNRLCELADVTMALPEPVGGDADAFGEEMKRKLDGPMEVTGNHMMRLSRKPEVMAAISDVLDMWETMGR